MLPPAAPLQVDAISGLEQQPASLTQSETDKLLVIVRKLSQSGVAVVFVRDMLKEKGFQNADEVGAAAVDYLRVAGHLVFGYFWARMAQTALREIAAGNTDPFYKTKLQTARFYFAKLFPETAMLMRTARGGAKVLMDTEEALA